MLLGGDLVFIVALLSVEDLLYLFFYFSLDLFAVDVDVRINLAVLVIGNNAVEFGIAVFELRNIFDFGQRLSILFDCNLLHK